MDDSSIGNTDSARANGGQSGGEAVETGGAEAAGGSSSQTGGASAGDSSEFDGGTIPLPPKFVGNIDTRGSIREDFATYWKQYTPENAGKWGSVERTRGSFNWSRLDASY